METEFFEKINEELQVEKCVKNTDLSITLIISRKYCTFVTVEYSSNCFLRFNFS